MKRHLQQLSSVLFTLVAAGAVDAQAATLLTGVAGSLGSATTDVVVGYSFSVGASPVNVGSLGVYGPNLQVTLVPEPSTFLMFFAAGALACVFNGRFVKRPLDC